MVHQAPGWSGDVLQEVGCSAKAAQEAGVKVAEDPTTTNRVLTALLGPIYGGATAPEGKGWKTFGHTLGKGAVGTVAGGAGGAGLGALAALASKGRIDPATAAQLMGQLGALGGGVAGRDLGLTSGYK